MYALLVFVEGQGANVLHSQSTMQSRHAAIATPPVTVNSCRCRANYAARSLINIDCMSPHFRPRQMFNCRVH